MKRVLELIVLSMLAAPRPAQAQQNQGFASDRFEPADRGSDSAWPRWAFG